MLSRQTQCTKKRMSATSIGDNSVHFGRKPNGRLFYDGADPIYTGAEFILTSATKGVIVNAKQNTDISFDIFIDDSTGVTIRLTSYELYAKARSDFRVVFGQLYDALQKVIEDTASKDTLIFNEFIQAAAKSLDPSVSKAIHGLSGGYSLLLTPKSRTFVHMVIVYFVCSQIPKLKAMSIGGTLTADDLIRVILTPDLSLGRFDPATSYLFSPIRSALMTLSPYHCGNIAASFAVIRASCLDMSPDDWKKSSFSGIHHARVLRVTPTCVSILMYPAMFGVDGESKTLLTSSLDPEPSPPPEE
jgi:hypothetical protein